MPGHKISLPARKKARIEIIPLIDVIFFLLATFVLFTLSLNRIQSVEVPLPSGVPPKNDSVKDEPATIQVSGEGAIFWNRDPVELTNLEAIVTDYKRSSASEQREPKILITGDEKAHFGDTVRVLDIIRKVGIKQFSMETRTRATGK